MTKQATGKSLGFVVGDFVWTGAFPGIIISDVRTYAPCCEVWGIEHEMGSAYATDLRKLTYSEWLMQAKGYGFTGEAYSEVSKKAIKEAEAQTVAR